MSYMFSEASAFNQPIENWDIDNAIITNMLSDADEFTYKLKIIMKFADPIRAALMIFNKDVHQLLDKHDMDKLTKFIKVQQINS